VQGSVTQVNNTTVAYNTSSDARLKTNVRDFPNSGDLIDRMQPRVFGWKANGKVGHGFIAQELNQVYPEAVSVGGEDAKLKPWQVDYSKLTPVLVAEVKDLRRRVHSLELVVGFFGFLFIGQFVLSFRKRK
jgi:hypothetical protein